MPLPDGQRGQTGASAGKVAENAGPSCPAGRRGGVSNGIATTERFSRSPKCSIRSHFLTRQPLLGTGPRYMCPPNNLYPRTAASFDSPKMEASWMPTDGRADKENVVQLHEGASLSHERAKL